MAKYQIEQGGIYGRQFTVKKKGGRLMPGTWFSLEMAEKAKARYEDQDNPQVGMGATYRLATDTYACTIVEVRKNGRELVLQRDKAKLLNGFNSGAEDALVFTPGGFAGHTSGEQRYEYERDPDGELIRVSRRTNRSGETIWVQVGHRTKSPGCRAQLGFRHEHYDYNY
jgi:hypothetical protein